MDGVTELKLGVDGVLVGPGGARCALTRSEAGLLLAVVRRNGAAVRKESLMQDMYQGQDEPEMKIIDVFACKLRKKMDAAFGLGRALKTVWGVGYQLDTGLLRLALPDADHVLVEVDKPTLRRLEELAVALDTDVNGVVCRLIEERLPELEREAWS